MKKDPFIEKALQKLKHPAVITFFILLGILIILGLIVDYIRPPLPTPPMI